MITFNSANIYKKPNVSFKAFSGYSDININGCTCQVNNFTTFFRNYPTLDFTKNYLLKNFPDGTHISEFGCSTGQKPYSLMIVLDKYNKEKKYKMTGYDFPEVIKKHKECSLYGISSYLKEEQILFDEYQNSYLFDGKYIDTKSATEIKDTFFKYFEKYRPKNNVTTERYRFLEKLVQNNSDLSPEEIKRAKDEICYRDLIDKCSCVVKAKENAKELLEFKSGNINDIDKLLIAGQSGVVIFQNALYHILSNNKLDYEINDLAQNVYKTEILFKKINRVLPQNGIFVLGSLPSDHIYDFEREENTRLHYQDNKQIRVYDCSPVHTALKKNGFEPVFYENAPEKTGYVKYRDVYLPSVWKKIRDV